MINQIMEALSSALVAVLLALIPIFGKEGIKLIKAFVAAAQAKAVAAKYNQELTVAKNVWGIVDETFRITPALEKTVENKIAMFETEILKKCPYLTADEIDHLRQAIAGQINAGKEAVTASAEAVTAAGVTTPQA